MSEKDKQAVVVTTDGRAFIDANTLFPDPKQREALEQLGRRIEAYRIKRQRHEVRPRVPS